MAFDIIVIGAGLGVYIADIETTESASAIAKQTNTYLVATQNGQLTKLSVTQQ
jgi:hypothetical protein